jgi:DNA-binding Xre family transcriptional regulator
MIHLQTGELAIWAGLVSREQNRLPLEDFERIMREPDQNDTEFARTIGVSRDVVKGWKEQGGIRFYAADRLCISLGYHPSYFWGEKYWQPPKSTYKKTKLKTTNEEQ